MGVKTLTQPAVAAGRRRPAVAKRRGAAKAAVSPAYDDMTEDELYALLDERLEDLSRRVSAGLSRAEERLKRPV